MLAPQTGCIHGERKLHHLIRYMVLNISLTYLMAAIFYADPFRFWKHAPSELGSTVTLLDSPNLFSTVNIIAGMFINSRLLLDTTRIYQEYNQIELINPELKTHLT